MATDFSQISYEIAFKCFQTLQTWNFQPSSSICTQYTIFESRSMFSTTYWKLKLRPFILKLRTFGFHSCKRQCNELESVKLALQRTNHSTATTIFWLVNCRARFNDSCSLHWRLQKWKPNVLNFKMNGLNFNFQWLKTCFYFQK